MTTPDTDPISVKAVQTAQAWQERANRMLTHEEKGIQEQMQRLLTSPMDKVIMTKLIDQSFRSHDPARVANQVNSILTSYGVPDFFSRVEKLLMQMFLDLGRHFPALAVPKMIKRMRQNSSRAIISGDQKLLRTHLEKRKRQRVHMNINHLGEAVLGEEEARGRVETYVADMKNPHIEYISVKISTIYSQISSLAFDHSVAVLKERLAEIYAVAKENVYERFDGKRVPKFVNLDMEEYRDLEVTYAAFTQTLDQASFKDYSAGIVLQAYLPDSFKIQQDLTAWAKKRTDAGGAPIRLRIVKGANMEMEQVEASLQNWPLAPYDNKLDVDANYKRMVRYGMQPENIHSVHLGIASHNLFELAYAYHQAKENGVEDYYYFEMLEGMADHVRRALCETQRDVLLYAPVATREQFIYAIGYLIRRLDENTSPENFIRYACDLKADSKEWKFLQAQFEASVAHMDKAGDSPHRVQDRQRETFPEKFGTFHDNEFNNEPDTDWSLKANRKWAEDVRERWKMAPGDTPVDIPLVVAGEEISSGRELRDCLDPSQINANVLVARYRLADKADVETAVAAAGQDPDGWRRLSHTDRHEVLSRVAMELRRARGDLIGAAAASTGKVFTEADVEVSEAIDFAEYYPFSARTFFEMPNIAPRGRGVGAVVSPWNFPIAIPCGGILAALSAGNTVIFKPASDAVLTAWLLCQCFWRAGVSQKVLQFLPCSGADTGSALVTHPGVDFVILTGGTETGMAMLRHKPEIVLAAETGGKNTTIVTAMADRDQTTKNVLYSAFGNSGQKCSATSLLILEKEIYADPAFQRQLVDAAQSFATGSAWDFENRMGPLIRPPGGDLKRALTTLEPGESWALEPRNVQGNPYLWTPGIKWGVQPGSYTHRTEFFGPLLGVMQAENLEHAIELANATGYGLTAGIESLDRREQERWKRGIRAGNLYINRGTTGAITLRQPFGGMGKSALGPAVKAGSPNYAAQFMTYTEAGFPPINAIKNESQLLRLAQEWKRKVDWGALSAHAADLLKTARAVKSYLYHAEEEFFLEKDYFNLRGQDNVYRYLPISPLVVRLHPDDSLFDILARVAAARAAGCDLTVSIPEGMITPATEFLLGREGQRLTRDATIRRETDAELIAALPAIARIRYAAPDRVPLPVLKAAAEIGFYVARDPVLMEGRIELLHYFQNQSVCDTYHRYGNLGERSLE